MKLLILLFAATAAHAQPAAREVEQVLKRDFHARGQATMERVAQDGLQRLCTESNDRPPCAMRSPRFQSPIRLPSG